VTPLWVRRGPCSQVPPYERASRPSDLRKVRRRLLAVT
jgi:hypothetical protein